MLKGGCLCGQVRYETSGTPFHETQCHCSSCRRAAGSPYVAWFTVERSSFRFTAGEPSRYRSSAKCLRSFCPRCGTSLTYETEDYPQEIDVTTGSLDEPGAVPPKDHTWTSGKVAWVRLDDQLPKYPAAREP